ncbi:MAG: hypothetical protein MJA31_17185 [Clostridia bacterium]|nr:hypothetical protein [Clostridia bacterium]
MIAFSALIVSILNYIGKRK